MLQDGTASVLLSILRAVSVHTIPSEHQNKLHHCNGDNTTHMGAGFTQLPKIQEESEAIELMFIIIITPYC